MFGRVLVSGLVYVCLYDWPDDDVTMTSSLVSGDRCCACVKTNANTRYRLKVVRAWWLRSGGL